MNFDANNRRKGKNESDRVQKVQKSTDDSALGWQNCRREQNKTNCLMNAGDKDMMSEESEDDGAGESREEMIYRRKYQMLLERCEVLQQDNERLVHRIQQVFKYTRQVRKVRKFLMDRLDSYGDNWRQGITQYYYENAQPNKPPNKLKQHHPHHSSEKRGKRPSGSTKKSAKEKSESDMPARKYLKESGNKSNFKNLSNYNFM